MSTSASERKQSTWPEKDVVIWHDVECGAYTADLRVWEELAAGAGGPVLDLGCGTGRVGLHLARRGHEVLGLDLDVELVAAFQERAVGLPAEARVADARDFDLGRGFALVLAPMQVLQLFESAEERQGCFAALRRHLAPGGRAAIAIVEGIPPTEDGAPVLPDVRQVGGWVYSSLPVDAAATEGRIAVRRLRQTVSPDGDLTDEQCDVLLCAVTAAGLEREAETAGLRPAGRLEVPPTEAHVGSTVVLLEAEA